MEKILNHYHEQIYEKFHVKLDEHDDRSHEVLVRDYNVKKKWNFLV